MLKRVELARALVVKPEILYMDEPFSALDALMSLRMRKELLRILAVERHTVVLITHDVEEAIQLADRIFVLSAPADHDPGDLRGVLRAPAQTVRAPKCKTSKRPYCANWVCEPPRSATGAAERTTPQMRAGSPYHWPRWSRWDANKSAR